MPNSKDLVMTPSKIKVMSVGESGTGKSIFAASFPTPGYVFDFGGEIASYRGKDFDYHTYEISAKGWGEFENHFVEVKKRVLDGRYITVVIDNISSMTDTCMEKALQLDPKRSLTNGPLWEVHYSMVKNLMEGRLRQFLNLPCNVVMIAHLDVIKNEEGAVIGVEPSMTGKLSGDIPAYFSEVYYHTVRKEGGGETKWVIQTVPIGRNHGRSRLSGKERLLPDLVLNDYDEILAYLTGKKKKQVTVPQQLTTTKPSTRKQQEKTNG